jgi:hypothetical protein
MSKALGRFAFPTPGKLTVFLTIFLGMHTSRNQKTVRWGGVFSLRRLVLENALERVIRSLFGTLFTTEEANRWVGFRKRKS